MPSPEGFQEKIDALSPIEADGLTPEVTVDEADQKNIAEKLKAAMQNMQG